MNNHIRHFGYGLTILGGTVLVGVLSACEPEDECSPAWQVYSEDNILYDCDDHATDGPFSFIDSRGNSGVELVDCSEYQATCRDRSNAPTADCFYLDFWCEEGIESMCIDGFVASCGGPDHWDHPSVRMDGDCIAQGKFCQVGETGINASCQTPPYL